MKSVVKKIIVTLCIIIGIYAVMFYFASYGWKLFGFAMCNNVVFAETIVVENNRVYISGGMPDSVSAYVGNVYKIDGSNLYIGVNSNLLLGFITNSSCGSYKISIDTGTTKIEKIYFKDNKSEKLIWTEGEGRLKQ